MTDDVERGVANHKDVSDENDFSELSDLVLSMHCHSAILLQKGYSPR